MMNRDQRRKYWKEFHKEENLGTWKEYNAKFVKQKPIKND